MGAAKVLSVKPCPKIQDGPGRVVLMKSTTLYTGEMATVKFTGSPEQVTGTFGHPVYSLDRGAEGEGGYVPLGELQPGERVRTADGWATVESLCRSWSDGLTVYNLEVEADHRYLVGELRVDCHNAGPVKCYRGGPDLTPGKNDLKVVDGMAQPGRGVPLNTDPAKVEQFGGAFEVGKTPDSLVVKQRGVDPGHFEIMPKQPMSVPDYTDAVKTIPLKPAKPKS